ncbi:hypothetical protein [Gorillibacterium timonense]|uniref:hypothetical protein n=1 Tax=Gorillibacterium timonense TaxID=1689269 RepID=UPI00131BA4F0|nr:hypothetical protein [Gorillibacterium timonense]
MKPYLGFLNQVIYRLFLDGVMIGISEFPLWLSYAQQMRNGDLLAPLVWFL